MRRTPEASWQEPIASTGKRHSFAYRKLELEDGTEVRALATRYSYAEGRYIRRDGPRGGRRLHTFPRTAYYLDGRFYRIRRAPKDEQLKEWHAWLEPLAGTIVDAYPLQSEAEGIPAVSIRLDCGYPVSVSGELPWSKDSGIAFSEGIAPWLHLDRKPRLRAA